MKATYPAVDYVTVTAVPSAGYVFDSWSGQTNSENGYQGITDVHQNPVTFQIGDDPDNNREITANFIPSDLHCTLNAIVEPSSAGSVGLQPAQPAEGYAVNESVRVFATAESGYVFSHWVGDVAGSENPRTILVSED